MNAVEQIYTQRLGAVSSLLDSYRAQIISPSETFQSLYQDRIGSLYTGTVTDEASQAISSYSGTTSDIASIISSMSGLGLDSSSYMSVLNAMALRQISDALTAAQSAVQPAPEPVQTEEAAEKAAPITEVTAADAPDGLPALNLPVTEYDDIINQASETYALPAYLIKGVIQAESSFRSGAVSSAGAQGLMQLMPGTAGMLGVTDSFDPAQNIDAGSKYLRQLIDRYDGDVRMALAAYNCGPSRVADMTAGAPEGEKYGAVAASVRGYVDKVITNARGFAI